MDIREIRTYAPLLHSICQCRGNDERTVLMSHLNDPALKFICKWMDRGVSDPSLLRLSPKRLKRLKSALERDKARVKYLTKPGGNMARKRSNIRQSGQGVGLLLAVLAPTLINLVKEFIHKKATGKSLPA